MDSCFLCVIGGASMPAPGTRKASEGFGTCHTCDVHACQIHGDKLKGQAFFRCADCLTSLGLITAVTASPPSGPAGATPVDPATHRILGRGGRSLFRAIAPGATASAAPLAAEADYDAMTSSLVDLLVQVQLGDPFLQATVLWANAPLGDLRRALGLPYGDRDEEEGAIERPYGYDEEDTDERRGTRDRELGADVLQVAAETFQLEAQDWSLRSPGEMRGQAELAAWALATAYAARGAQTLNTSPFRIAGGLRLPPIALLLAMTYQNRVSH